ncbi:hypothetical protein BJY00DRAFT_314248 [Aspergillus carlsbadensis]|nr:hypothetical protein BJY00DRAFT_314248 [Aspergillus carlsbadensis]
MPLKRAIGPLDKRNRVSRCQACAARKIRCSGGVPCDYCVKSTRVCYEQKQRKARSVFVHHTQTPTSQCMSAAKGTTSLPKQIPQGLDSRFLDYSIALLDCNRLTHNHVALAADLLPLLRTSSLLSSAVRAVGALSASRHGSVCMAKGRDSPYFIAFTAYSASISALQATLADRDIARRDDVLWATFFLGLFELMVDPSGEGWAKHMLSGTSKLLQLAGPENGMTGSRRTFFDVFRVLEATRAIIYGHNTILAAPGWVDLQRETSSQITTCWKGMDEILSLMIRVSTFSARFFESTPKIASSESSTLVDDLGREGLAIQSSIYAWHDEAMLKLQPGDNKHSVLHLALACYHTLLVFLSNNYNYYQFWHDTPAPRLSRNDINHHVESILQHADHILKASDISTVLLLFPLRVAGTHAESGTRFRILGLLDAIFARGFVVSSRIKDDLHEYWVDKDSPFPIFDPL